MSMPNYKHRSSTDSEIRKLIAASGHGVGILGPKD